jgi:NAD(P)-dependent dehydrogenase (short-subunit alcohol dehydrogenase family)
VRGAARQVLLVGATQGLGLALAEKYLREGCRVLATTIDPSTALQELAVAHAGMLEVATLDITDATALQSLRQRCAGRLFDVLHIVAGVFQKTMAPIWQQDDQEILRLLHTNAIGGIRLAELLAQQVTRGGVFAFTSSGMGSMARNDKGDVDLYRISKASLNMLVRSFAVRHAASGCVVLLLCPGWAKTAMGGPDATVDVSTSVDGMYACITNARRPSDGGAVFIEYTGNIIPW